MARVAYRWQVRGELVIVSKQKNDRYCFDKAQIADKDWLVPLESALIYTTTRSSNLGQQRAQMAVEKAPQAYYPWYVLGALPDETRFRSRLPSLALTPVCSSVRGMRMRDRGSPSSNVRSGRLHACLADSMGRLVGRYNARVDF